MAGFNYPIRVLKKKMAKPNYEPFAIDCSSGSPIVLENSKAESMGYFFVQLLVTLSSIALIYFTLVDPLIQITQARHSVEQSLSILNEVDSSTLEQLKNQGTVVSESAAGEIVTLVLKVDREKLDESLDLAFSLTGVKEVSTDGKSIAVSFISSGK